MSAQTWQIIAIVIYLAAMVVIGVAATRRNKNLDDYMLGGRSLSPGTAALSAGASDMSGWLLMGLPGAIYAAGLVEAWIAIGLTVGAWLNWKFVAPRLRSYTEVAGNSITVPSFFHNRLRDRTRVLRVLSSLIILLFFTFYVSSGMVSGGKFFQSSFGSDYLLGMLLVGGVTVFYTLFGGFLGATYTDVVQGLLILAAMVISPIIALTYIGGWDGMVDAVTSVNPDAFSLIAGGTAAGIISSVAWGLGYFGQPHIIVRFMALRSPADAKAGRRIGIAWMALSVIGAISVGLIGLAYFTQHPEAQVTDQENFETVFLDLSQILFHPLIAGFILAAVLAAIMSTISSQLVVCSSALVEDLYLMVAGRAIEARRGLWLGRIGVLVVAVVAVLLALDPNSSILQLVGFAWAGFGAAFGPLIILSLYWKRLTAAGATVGMAAGAAVVFAWGTNDTLSSSLYEIVPGFAANLILAVVVSLLTARPEAEIGQEFDEAVAASRGQSPERAAAAETAH